LKKGKNDMRAAAYSKPGFPYPVFIAGIKYTSLFSAWAETGISQTSLSIGLKKKSGGPCKIKRCIVVLESWVLNRVENLGREYAP
jgi:hypothetical protein